MKNPLSYTNSTIFTGKEINDWCYAQLEKGTSNAARIARRLLRKNYKDDRIYRNVSVLSDTGADASLMIVFERCRDEY